MSENDETATDVSEDAPAWLEEFVQCVVETCECETGLGWRWAQEEDEDSEKRGNLLEVQIYPRVIEVQGEPCTPSDVFYDVQEILDLFDKSDTVGLMFGCSDEIDHLAIGGTVGGHDVWLLVLMSPPEDEKPTLRMHDDGTVEDISEGAKAHYSEAGHQATVDAEHELANAVGDVVGEIVRSWKADRLVPSDLLDRLGQLFVEVS